MNEMHVARPVWSEEPVLSFQDAEGEYLRFDFMRLITYSTAQPWELVPVPWRLIAAEQRADACMYIFSDSRAEVEMRGSASGQAACLQLKISNRSTFDWPHFSCALQLPVISREPCKVVIPHVIYEDNPSADPDRLVPHIGQTPGEGSVFEEHRLPIPAVSVEWGSEGCGHFLTLLSQPEVITGDDADYWSLGALCAAQGMTLAALSGPVMLNGRKDMTYGGQCAAVPFTGGYRTLAAGESLSKTIYLQSGIPAGAGKGFQSLVRLGYEVLQPKTKPAHLLEEMIAYKKNVLDHRFHEGPRSTGYICYGASNSFGDISGRPEYYLYAWTGQALKLAWCDCVLGLKDREDFRFRRGVAAADFFVRYSQAEVRGLRRAYYYHQSDSWGLPGKGSAAGNYAAEKRNGKTVEVISSRMQGEALADLIDIMLLLRESGQNVPDGWEAAVGECCAFLMNAQYQTQEGIYPFSWHPDGRIADPLISAAGVPCLSALVKAYRYFGRKDYLAYAAGMYAVYADLHMRTFDRPFARATMDARCEDKEAGIAFFLAAHELFKATCEQAHQTWAEIAADWLLTFVYFWNTGFRPGSLCARQDMNTTGWPGVSVQNHHLDVFFPTFELYEFGQLTGSDRYMQMAGHIRNGLTQGVCTYPGEWGFSVVGEQGEQYYQTNFGQHGQADGLEGQRQFWRGGMYVWNPSWITAQILSNSLKFLVMSKSDFSTNYS